MRWITHETECLIEHTDARASLMDRSVYLDDDQAVSGLFDFVRLDVWTEAKFLAGNVRSKHVAHVIRAQNATLIFVDYGQLTIGIEMIGREIGEAVPSGVEPLGEFARQLMNTGQDSSSSGGGESRAHRWRTIVPEFNDLLYQSNLRRDEEDEIDVPRIELTLSVPATTGIAFLAKYCMRISRRIFFLRRSCIADCEHFRQASIASAR